MQGPLGFGNMHTCFRYCSSNVRSALLACSIGMAVRSLHTRALSAVQELQVITLDDPGVEALVGMLPTCAPEAPRDPSTLAYIIYTSGSTGRPKGVMVPHRGVVNYIQHDLAVCGIQPDDIFLQRVPISFDVSVTDIFEPLAAGASIVPSAQETNKDPKALLHQLAVHDITVLSAVPSLLQAWLNAGLTNKTAPKLR